MSELLNWKLKIGDADKEYLYMTYLGKAILIEVINKLVDAVNTLDEKVNELNDELIKLKGE